MLKKTLILFQLLLMAPIGTFAQSAYVVPNFRSADKYSSTNMNAISLESITPLSNNEYGYEIKFCDTQNTNRAVEQYATSFTFYLSYKGKRISDYQTANSNYKYHFTCTCYIWPNAIPKGHERYVTVQMGKEPIKKDPRDDD